MKDYETKVEENNRRNEKFVDEFEKWLIEKGMSNKTIKNHLSNIKLYINDYLTYYDITTMEDGVSEVYGFLNDWFIRKCLWASKSSIKSTAASIKKFYGCMSELGYVKTEDYKDLCKEIKECMDEYLDTLDDFDNGNMYSWF